MERQGCSENRKNQWNVHETQGEKSEMRVLLDEREIFITYRDETDLNRLRKHSQVWFDF